MKTTSLLMLLLFAFSCEKGAYLEDAPSGVSADTQVDQTAAPCLYPKYNPPTVVPGTNCHNPCQFVYEGWVDFETGRLDINCRQLPLSSPTLSFSVDSTLVRHVDTGYVKVLRIRAPGIGAWCRGKTFFRAEGCPPPERVFLFVGSDGMSEYRVLWPEGFWGCAAGKQIHFRLVARNPLGLKEGP